MKMYSDRSDLQKIEENTQHFNRNACCSGEREYNKTSDNL